MPTKLFSLGSRYVLDSGEVVYSKDAAIEYVRDGGALKNLVVEYDEAIKLYERISGRPLKHSGEDGISGQLPTGAHDWNVPPEYTNFDVEVFCREKLSTSGINTPAYNARLQQELALFAKNNMLQLVIIIKALVDDFRKREVVWGVGRGSSCASLVLFLVGIHRVDPIKYDIDLKEFFKELRHGHEDQAKEDSDDD